MIICYLSSFISCPSFSSKNQVSEQVLLLILLVSELESLLMGSGIDLLGWGGLYTFFKETKIIKKKSSEKKGQKNIEIIHIKTESRFVTMFNYLGRGPGPGKEVVGKSVLGWALCCRCSKSAWYTCYLIFQFCLSFARSVHSHDAVLDIHRLLFEIFA